MNADPDRTVEVKRIPAGRAFAFAFLSALIVLGPADTQLFGRVTPFLRPWQMFRDRGIDHFTVEYWRITPSGTRVPLERAVLHAEPSPGRLTSLEQAVREARAVARRLSPPDRLHIRILAARHAGWDTVLQTDLDASPGAGR